MVVKMGFFDKIDDSTIVDTFRQFLDRTDREIFCTYILQVGTLSVKVHENHALLGCRH